MSTAIAADLIREVRDHLERVEIWKRETGYIPADDYTRDVEKLNAALAMMSNNQAKGNQ